MDETPEHLRADADRLDRLEASLAALGEAVDGHSRWLADLQAGTADLVSAAGSHSEWLDSLERWMRSCVRVLANFGSQPIVGGFSSSGSFDLVSTLAKRLEVWAVMMWIAEAAVVEPGPLVSVTIGTRNRPEFLQRAIRSVLAQSYGRLELIVVDDSDDDATAELLASIDDSRVRSVRTPARRGCPAAFNIALDEVRGDLIAFLDDDNLMHSEWLRSVVWAFGEHPDLDALYGARVNEDLGALGGTSGGMLPTLEFQAYDRRKHERANYVDRNTMAVRSSLRRFRYDESLKGAYDWDHSLRVFAEYPPLALPAVSCFYRTHVPNRESDLPDLVESFRIVRARAHANRPLEVHVHTEMYPVISESYIGEDIRSLDHCGAVVTVSANTVAASIAPDAPPCRMDPDEAISEAQPDVVLLHWATHAYQQLPRLERHEVPFACRVHTFDCDADIVAKLIDHPLCAAVFAHPHHLGSLPEGVQPIIPTVGPWTRIPDSPPDRDLVLSLSAGLPKKRFPFLIDAMSRVPEFERQIIMGRTNGVEELPDEVIAGAAEKDPGIAVRVNVPRAEALEAMARASVLIYTLVDDTPMGWPMSILEAMLCGTIVIAPDRPEVYALLGDEALVYHDEDEIAEHVRRVAAGGASVEKARQALRDRAKPHTSPEALRTLHDGIRAGVSNWLLTSN